MKVYVFQAALLCQGCGNEARADIKHLHPEKVPALDALGFPLDESSFDSDDYPKGPYGNGGGEADTPQHCDRCGVFLENPLTEDGADYVRQAAEKYTCREVDDSWADVADRADKEGGPTVAEWIRYYFAPGM